MNQVQSDGSLQKCQLQEKATNLALTILVCRMDQVTRLSENLRKIRALKTDHSGKGSRQAMSYVPSWRRESLRQLANRLYCLVRQLCVDP